MITPVEKDLEPPALLLGASGFLGVALSEALKGAVGTYNRHPVEGGISFDVKRTTVTQLVSRLRQRPSAALILFGVTSIDACARDPAGTAELNVHATIRVIAELRSLGITPVFASSDAVFDGSRSFWKEDDAARPVLTYGRQKLEVENYIRSLSPPWLIVRLPKLVSAKCNRRCMLTGWVEALGRSEQILCATDQFFTPAEAGDVARELVKLVSGGETGLYHLGGPERLSRRSLLAAVMEEYRRYSVPKAQVVECSLRDVPVLEPRPLDTSLDSTRYASRLGRDIRPASEVARLAVRDCFENMETSRA